MLLLLLVLVLMMVHRGHGQCNLRVLLVLMLMVAKQLVCCQAHTNTLLLYAAGWRAGCAREL